MEVFELSQEPMVKPRPRIQTLSDLVFGLALSISALTLIGQQPTTINQLATSLGLYGFSFLILISVWRIYSTVTSILPVETSFLTNLNVVLLFLVSIEPYLFNELFALSGDLNTYVSNLYALDLAVMFLIMAFFNHYLAIEEKKLVPKNLLGKYRLHRNLCLIVVCIFLISIAPFFANFIVLSYTVEGMSYIITLRSFLWIFALLIGWSRYLWERMIKNR
jgi:uncharacterized membrane protein